MVVLAAWNYQGLILALIIIAAYIGILVELKHLAEQLEQAGYVLEEQPVWISDGKYYSCSTTVAAMDMTLALISDNLDVSIAEKIAEERKSFGV